MPVEYVNEPVEVRVDFCNRRVLPRAMSWNSRLYTVKSINMIHSARNGTSKLFFFSVSDNINYFKLQLDTESLEWRLIEMYSDAAL